MQWIFSRHFSAILNSNKIYRTQVICLKNIKHFQRHTICAMRDGKRMNRWNTRVRYMPNTLSIGYTMHFISHVIKFLLATCIGCFVAKWTTYNGQNAVNIMRLQTVFFVVVVSLHNFHEWIQRINDDMTIEVVSKWPQFPDSYFTVSIEHKFFWFKIIMNFCVFFFSFVVILKINYVRTLNCAAEKWSSIDSIHISITPVHSLFNQWRWTRWIEQNQMQQ